MDDAEKPWKWFVFGMEIGSPSPDVALECQYSIDDFKDGLPKMIRGRNLCGVGISQDAGKLVMSIVQDPAGKNGAITMYSPTRFARVIEVCDSDILSKLGAAVGRQELFRPGMFDTKKINEEKKNFESMKGGKK